MNNITLPVAELKPALTGIGKVIGRKITLPVLGAVQINRDKEGWITLTGTDLDSTVTVRMENPDEGKPLTMLVPHSDLARLVKDCGVSDSITLEPGKNDRVHVGYPIGNQKGELHLESIPANEFPPIPQIKGETCAIKDEVRQSIVEALQCASTDETRMILQGAYLDVSDKKTTTSSARMESTSSAATHSRCR